MKGALHPVGLGLVHVDQGFIMTVYLEPALALDAVAGGGLAGATNSDVGRLSDLSLRI